jgi:hypothetical protein
MLRLQLWHCLPRLPHRLLRLPRLLLHLLGLTRCLCRRLLRLRCCLLLHGRSQALRVAL